jgi:hypothetical protein
VAGNRCGWAEVLRAWGVQAGLREVQTGLK